MRDGVQYGTADVLLFDAIPANRTATRMALGMLGFNRITATSDVDEAAQGISQRPCDVLIADLSVEPERICQMVRDVRQGDTAPNPFVIVMLTAWGVRGENANGIMASGADDVLLRPFSASFLAERVRTLVDARKDFVVTSDYIGPNRRKASDRTSYVRMLEVPNTLRLKAKPEAGAACIDIASTVRDARAKVGEMRLVGSALQLRLLAYFALRAVRDGGVLDRYIVPMSAISRLLFDKLDGASDPAVAAASSSLLEASAAVMQGGDIAASLEASGKAARLIHRLLSPRRSEEDLDQEFEHAVARLTQRMTQSVLEAVAVG